MARCLSANGPVLQCCSSLNAEFLSSQMVTAWFPVRLNLGIKRANEACFLDSCFINCCLSESYCWKKFIRVERDF